MILATEPRIPTSGCQKNWRLRCARIHCCCSQPCCSILRGDFSMPNLVIMVVNLFRVFQKLSLSAPGSPASGLALDIRFNILPRLSVAVCVVESNHVLSVNRRLPQCEG